MVIVRYLLAVGCEKRKLTIFLSFSNISIKSIQTCDPSSITNKIKYLKMKNLDTKKIRRLGDKDNTDNSVFYYDIIYNY